MKKLLLIGAAAVACAATVPAIAQVTGEVDVNGFVDDRCQFTVDNAVIDLGEISGGDGKVDAAAVNAGAATLKGWCNGSAATIKVEAFPLVNTAAGSASFDTVVHYRATATAGTAAPFDDSADGGAGADVSLGLFNGDIVVDMSNAASANGRLLVAGDYNGSIVVTLNPNVSFGEVQPESQT